MGSSEALEKSQPALSVQEGGTSECVPVICVALVGDTPRSVADCKHRKVCFSQEFRTLGPSQPPWEPLSPTLMRRCLVTEQMLPDGAGLIHEHREAAWGRLGRSEHFTGSAGPGPVRR